MSSYVTNSDANTYFLLRYNSSIWDSTSETDKTKLLATATRLIDRLNFLGDRADEEQELEFPRGIDTEVPQAIKDATCEIAYMLRDGRDVEYEAEQMDTNTNSMGGSRLLSSMDVVNMAKIHGIPSAVAWSLLRPYLREGSVITLSRID
jgi:hypothetical protein